MQEHRKPDSPLPLDYAPRAPHRDAGLAWAIFRRIGFCVGVGHIMAGLGNWLAGTGRADIEWQLGIGGALAALAIPLSRRA